MKEKTIQLCPIHKCGPEYRKEVLREKSATFLLGDISELAYHYFYCPKCYRAYFLEPSRKLNSSSLEAKFGYGFSSQHSKSAARGNWNNAVLRFKRTAFKKAIQGKDVDERVFGS